MILHVNTQTQMEQKIIEVICDTVPGCLAVYRFGSWGTKDQRADSDIDLALLASSPLDPVKRWELAQQLASLVRRDVDLVDLLKASEVMRMQVIANGSRIYSAADNEVELFEDRVFASYARLNYERRAILDDVKKRGNIYGEQ